MPRTLNLASCKVQYCVGKALERRAYVTYVKLYYLVVAESGTKLYVNEWRCFITYVVQNAIEVPTVI